MRIGVIGGTGVLGRYLLPRLAERRHDVRVVVRRGSDTRRLRPLGVEIVEGDILDASSLRTAVATCDTVIHAATAIPKAGAPVDWSVNDRIRREGTANLIAACRSERVENYIQQSIAHLVANGTQQLLDETAPLHPSVVTQSAVEMEHLVEKCPLRWTILRGGIFYGPGTGQEAVWRAMARNAQLRIPLDGSAYISLVHVADYARAIVDAVEAPSVGATFNVVDDEPVSYKDLFHHIAAVETAPAPGDGAPQVWASCRVSNRRFKEAFGWQPCYATYRSGWI